MKSKFKIVSLIYLPILLGVMFSCTKGPSYPPEVKKTLKKAGDNRTELEKVLLHYTALGDTAMGDTLKFQAACFLLSNMAGHGYVTYNLLDSTDTQIDFDVTDYTDYTELQAAFDSLENQYGELDFKKDTIIYDIDVITSDLLINQIDQAFYAWQEKPWAKKLSFNQFCEFILPYRGSSEPLEHWRNTFLEKYKNLEETLENPSDPVEAASVINSDIMSWFKFDPRYYYHPTDQGLSEMLESGLGRCEDMTNLTIFAMRSNGLAVTSDYTPYWANAGNNHAWNAIVTPDGRAIPFMGAEANPGHYRLANKMAKVYRKTFSQQKQNLIFYDNKQEKVPGWLAGKSYVDVTSDYIDVCDVTVNFNKEVPDSINIAYLCVFNSGKWKAIAWGEISDNNVTFTDMGTDIVYLPALYINKEIEPFDAPFILNDDCTVRKLIPDDTNKQSIRLSSTTKRKQLTSTDGTARSFLSSGKEYELFYWQDDWQSLGSSVAGDKPLGFDQVPAGCLFWLVVDNSDKEERIFTIEDSQQVWW